jgi:hypothetical protein
MNPAIQAAIIAASQHEAIEEKIENRLKAANALGPSTAIAFAPADESGQKLLEAALATGNVVRTANGQFYLNERAAAERKEGQGFMALLIGLIFLSLVASGVALAMAGIL